MFLILTRRRWGDHDSSLMDAVRHQYHCRYYRRSEYTALLVPAVLLSCRQICQPSFSSFSAVVVYHCPLHALFFLYTTYTYAYKEKACNVSYTQDVHTQRLMANVLKRDRDTRRKQADATMRRMRQQHHMQGKQLLKRILDVCYNNQGLGRVSGIWVMSGVWGSAKDDWEPPLGGGDHPRDNVFRKAVGVISKALSNWFQLGKEYKFVIEVG